MNRPLLDLASKMKKNDEPPVPTKQIQKIPTKKSKSAKTSNNSLFYTSIENYNMLDIFNGRKPKGCTQRKEIVFLTRQTIEMVSSPHTDKKRQVSSKTL